MILDLDIGNTRVKWRMRHASGAIGEHGACLLDELLGGAAAIPSGLIDRIRAACVRGPAVEQQITKWGQGFCRQAVQFAAGVTNAYARPETLGVDRWLAILAAWNLEQSAVCVISCGSAITLDLVDAGGRHLGGLIAPGLAMMKRSLLADTDRVRFDPADAAAGLHLLPGRSTQACVAAGVATAAVGLINQACTEYRRLCPDLKAFITGGDAERIAPFLVPPASHRPGLVFDGLQLALP
jgi:type III pantothenate kinase